MYTIEFYAKENGESDVINFLEDLRKRASTNKDARVQYRQAAFYIELLANNGSDLPNNIAKKVTEDIWELRPGNNRIFYFCVIDGVFVLLHHFRKKSKKTPRSEIKRAIAERNDYIRRKGSGNR